MISGRARVSFENAIRSDDDANSTGQPKKRSNSLTSVVRPCAQATRVGHTLRPVISRIALTTTANSNSTFCLIRCLATPEKLDLDEHPVWLPRQFQAHALIDDTTIMHQQRERVADIFRPRTWRKRGGRPRAGSTARRGEARTSGRSKQGRRVRETRPGPSRTGGAGKCPGRPRRDRRDEAMAWGPCCAGAGPQWRISTANPVTVGSACRIAPAVMVRAPLNAFPVRHPATHEPAVQSAARERARPIRDAGLCDNVARWRETRRALSALEAIHLQFIVISINNPATNISSKT